MSPENTLFEYKRVASKQTDDIEVSNLNQLVLWTLWHAFQNVQNAETTA